MLLGEKINVWLSKKKVLDEVSFKIEDGDFIALIGSSGSGKSTLINTLLGFHKIDEGRLELNGRDITKHHKLLRKVSNFVSQSGSFYDKLTVRENFHYFGVLLGLKEDTIESRVELISEFLSLKQYLNVLAENLSGGTKKRLELGLGLLNQPKILFLDEPESGLDIILKNEIYEIISKINSMGTTIILTSHDLGMIQRFTRQFMILDSGFLSKKYDTKSVGNLAEFFFKYKMDVEKNAKNLH